MEGAPQFRWESFLVGKNVQNVQDYYILVSSLVFDILDFCLRGPGTPSCGQVDVCANRALLDLRAIEELCLRPIVNAASYVALLEPNYLTKNRWW